MFGNVGDENRVLNRIKDTSSRFYLVEISSGKVFCHVLESTFNERPDDCKLNKRKKKMGTIPNYSIQRQ